ncbi:MAG: NUDIX domain-containing protein [Bacilli bacterium]|nr:NUDIX domain-containing protein [Bacilli bacterium]
MIEYLDLVDEQDNVIGSEDRNIIYKKGLKNYRTVNILIINDENKVLVQKRTADRRVFPNRYDFSAAGHLDVGEDYNTAAYRELKEELGIETSLDELMYFNPNKHNVNSFKKLFIGKWNGEFRYDESAVKGIEFLTKDEILNLMKNNNELFVPDYYFVFKYINDYNLI